MGPFTRRFVIGVGILVAAVLLGASGYALKMQEEIQGMTPVETGYITPDLLAIRDGYVNMYLVQNGDGWIAVDTGEHPAVIQKALDALKIDPKQVQAVLLTHKHYDHSGGIGLFTEAEIYSTPQEKPSQRMTKDQQTKWHAVLDGSVIHPGGMVVNSIVIPGHTQGSCVFRVQGKYLFTGDVIRLRSGIAEPFNGFFNENSKVLVENIPRLNGLSGIQWIATGHSGISKDYEGAFKNWENRKGLPMIMD